MKLSTSIRRPQVASEGYPTNEWVNDKEKPNDLSEPGFMPTA